jgi:hypothetical protein
VVGIAAMTTNTLPSIFDTEFEQARSFTSG